MCSHTCYAGKDKYNSKDFPETSFHKVEADYNLKDSQKIATHVPLLKAVKQKCNDKESLKMGKL